jgi:hypothetical protein
MIVSINSINKIIQFTKISEMLFSILQISLQKIKQKFEIGINFILKIKSHAYGPTITITLNQNLFFNRGNLFLNKQVVF